MASNSLSKGQQNFTRLAIACVDEIKLVFKDSLESQIKPVDLYNAINTCSILTTGKHQLNAHQLNICRISPPQVPDYDKFDVSLLYKLIRNLCPKFKPTKGWGNKPDTNDLQIGDDIERLRLVRNEMLAHFESSDVPDGTFTTSWKELKSSFPRVQKFMTSLGYSVNYEDKLIDIEKLDLGLEDMKKYRVLLEGMIILCKQPQNKDVSKITVNGNGKILCGEKACFEAETEKCHDNSNWPITWERVRGSATEVIATSAEKYKGSSSRRLVIPQVVKGDEGEYRAVISREIDGIHVTIPSNTLFLQALGNPPNLDIFQATSGIDGVTIHYNCNADKAYPVIKEIEWRKDGELLTMNTNKYEGGGVTDKYLKILSPSDNDSGEYTCRVFNAVGSDVKCLVLGAPSVEICKELTVLLGSEVTIDPVIQSCPSLEKAIWQKSKAQAPEDFMTIDINDDQYFGSSLDPEKPVLVITKASHADNLYYRLEVSNGIRKSTSNAVLLKLVGDPPSVFTNVETNISDRSVTLLCKVSHSDNSPEVTKVVWTKDKRYINISSSGGKYAGGSTADPSLVVQNVNSNDAGEYQCCVSNVVGSMISNPIHLGKPKVHISSYEKDDETERTTCKITIESIPEVKAAEWRVQQSPEDDFQTIDVHATTYKGSTVSLPQPYLIVHGYNLNQSQRFQIRVTNFIGETTEIINDKKQDSEEHDQKELDDGMNFYRKGVIKIPFANLRYDLHDAFPQDKLENLKYLLICQEEVDEDTVSASNSLGDVLEILIKRGLFRKNDVILVQYLLRKIGCYDLYETCYKYAKDCEALCFFESQPENGYKNVRFHIDGNIEKYSKEDIYFIRKTVAKMLNCPEEHIAITGLEHDKSFVLILSIKEEYINMLLKHAQEILENLCSLNVDYLACGEIVIWKKHSTQEQWSSFNQSCHKAHLDDGGLINLNKTRTTKPETKIFLKVVEETVSQSADLEVSTTSSSDTTYTQTTSADTSKEVTPSNFPSSIPVEVIHVSTVVSDETREGEPCMKINRNQDEDKALEIEHDIAKYNLLSQTSFSDSQEQNNDEEGNVEKTIISLDSEDEVNEESTNKMKDIEMAVGYTKPWADETDYCVFDRNDNIPEVKTSKTVTEKDAHKRDICVSNLMAACQEKDCDKYHTRLPYLWQIHIFGDWISFDDEENQKLEKSYSNLEDMENGEVEYQGWKYRIQMKFNEEKGVVYEIVHGEEPLSTHDDRGIRRLSTASFAKEKKPLAAGSFHTQWRWYYQDDANQWILYDKERLQYTLEKKFLFGQKSYLFTRESYQFKYRIDFANWQQMNIDTAKVRTILRRPVFVSLADVAAKSFPMYLAVSNPGPKPPGWAPWDLAHDFELVDLEESNKEFREVKASFFSTLKEDNFQICNIYRIQNLGLWNEYKMKKTNMERINETRGGSVDERSLFHGTDSIDTCYGICTNNFDFRLSGKNATMYGQGSYFAATSKYSNCYTRGPLRLMLKAKVLIGSYTKGEKDMKCPPTIPGEGHKRYVSCVDDMANPTIFVVFDRNQSYPEYLIAYKEKDDAFVSSASNRAPVSRPVSRPTSLGATAGSSNPVPANVYSGNAENFSSNAFNSSGSDQAYPSRAYIQASSTQGVGVQPSVRAGQVYDIPYLSSPTSSSDLPTSRESPLESPGLSYRTSSGRVERMGNPERKKKDDPCSIQ